MTEASNESPPTKSAREASLALFRSPARFVERVRDLIVARKAARPPATAAARTQIAVRKPGAQPVAVLPDDPDENSLASTGNWAGRALILSFYAVVVAPTLCSIAYFGFVASDQYVSETRLTIRAAADPKSSLAGAADSLKSLFSSGPKSSIQDGYIIQNYARSRPVIEDIGGRELLEKIYSGDKVDYFSRLKREETLEGLWKYWGTRVFPTLDTLSGIVTIKVHAFTPEDARDLATRIVSASEELVNQISTRSRNDAIVQARKEVESAQERLLEARQAMLEYRNRNQTIDPVRKAEDIAKLISALTVQKIQLQTLIAGSGNALSPNAPSVKYNRSRLDELDRQIIDLNRQLTATDAGVQTVSRELSEYERLKLGEQFSEKLYEISVMALERSQQEASRQQLYLSTVVRPTLPERAIFPERMTNIVFSFVCFLVLWGIASLVSATLFDHMA